MLNYGLERSRNGYKYQVSKDKSLIEQCKEGTAHQKRFHFWEFDPTVETDKLVEAIWDDFTHGKRHIKITGVNRGENTISIEFEKKMCYKFGIHDIGYYKLELLKKRDLDQRIQEYNQMKKKERQSKWLGFQRGNL